MLIGIGALLLVCVALATLLPGPEQPAEPPAATPPMADRSTATPSPPPPAPALTEAQVIEVINGDTLRVSLGGQEQTVRIIGVDTPETKDPRKPVMCFGVEATVKTQELVDRGGGRVLLEKDVSETDQFGRLLRYIWLEHSDGRQMLNEELVKGGYAQVSTFPPDVKYADLFVAGQKEARDQQRGL